MANKIQIKRGLKTNLPILDSGEPGFCTDTGEVFFGDGIANHQVVMHNEYNTNTILAATSDNTPVALTIIEQRLVGRKTGGNIAALTSSEIMAILSGGATSSFSLNNQKITSLGTPTLTTDAATKAYVDGIIATNDAMVFKGTIGTTGTITSLPTTHNVGWTYKVITVGTYAGKVCEIGDMLISLITRTGSDNTNDDWAVVQANIDGAVTGPSSSVNNNIVVFDSITGKVIRDGGVAISGLATSTHVHGNITNDGKIGSVSGLVVITTTDGSLTTLAIGSSGQYLSYNGTWATPPDTATAIDDILDGSNSGTAITYAAYSTSQAASVTPKFYTHATNPSGASRLNVSSYFYATQLYDDGIRVHNQNSNIDGGSFPI